MAEDNERFRLQMTWLRDDKGKLITTEFNDENDEPEDVDGVIYYSDLEVGLPYEAILVLAATDVHHSKLRRIELTFDAFHIVLERTDEPATLGDRACSEANREEPEKAPVPVGPGGILRWH